MSNHSDEQQAHRRHIRRPSRTAQRASRARTITRTAILTALSTATLLAACLGTSAHAGPLLVSGGVAPLATTPSTPGTSPFDGPRFPALPHGLRGFAARLVAQTLNPAPPKPAAIVDAVVDPLMRGILERLAISEAVARTKFASGKPVEDRAREQSLLDTVGERAQRFGLTPAQARTFFRLQIDASKLVQNVLIARWQRDGDAAGGPDDLATSLRPALDRLSGSLLHDLGRVCALPDGPARMARIHQARERAARAAGLEALQRAALDEATSGLCLSAPPRVWTLSLL